MIKQSLLYEHFVHMLKALLVEYFLFCQVFQFFTLYKINVNKNNRCDKI
jgi:hypothetical protein